MLKHFGILCIYRRLGGKSSLHNRLAYFWITDMCALSLFKRASIERAHAAEEIDSFTRDGDSSKTGPSKGSKGMSSKKRARAELRNIHSTLGPQWSQPMLKMRKRMPPENSEMMPSASIPPSALSSRIPERKPTKDTGKQGATEGTEGKKGLEGLSALTESTLHIPLFAEICGRPLIS